MDVSCPACAARYTADDEKLRGKTARMRCKACNTVWLVSGPGASAAGAACVSDSSSKRAAVVRKGSEREKRDLFAEREPDHGSIKQTLLPPPSFGFNGGVGARNENSVLFRVDQLGATGRLKTPEPARAPARDASPLGADDEGIIDLKALSSAPPRKLGLPVAPLFSEPPAVSLDVGESSQRQAAKPASKMRLIGGIAAAAAFLLVAGFGLSLAFQSEEPVKHTAAVVAPTTEAPPPTPAPVAAVETKDAKDTAETKDAPETKGKKGKKGKAAKAAKSATITSKTPPPASKPVKAADPCGCKGDFNCILACTARGGK
ncbi:MAG: hypothetical protein K0S65_4013 [Labilithrix sp.]|nr:hypothetical protein [Labilithrix sp.]